MSVMDAAYRLAHGYPGGIPALAARMGKSANTLQHECNPNTTGHKLGLADAALMTALSGDPSIAQALARAARGVFVQLPTDGSVSDEALLEQFATLVQDFGQVGASMNEALADGRVTPREFERFASTVDAMCAAAVQLRERFSQLVERRPVPMESRPVSTGPRAVKGAA